MLPLAGYLVEQGEFDFRTVVTITSDRSGSVSGVGAAA